jgi:hypothetical protein
MMRYLALCVLLVLPGGCGQTNKPGTAQPKSAPVSSPAYSLRLTSWYGPTMGAGFSGSSIVEVDLKENRIRALSKHTGGGAQPEKFPHDDEAVNKLMAGTAWKALPTKEAAALQRLIAAWLETSPPAQYAIPPSPGRHPGHTTIAVSGGARPVTSAMEFAFDQPPPRYADSKLNHPPELMALLDRLSYLHNQIGRGQLLNGE